MRNMMTTLVILLGSAVVCAAPDDAADLMQGDKTLVVWAAPANLTQRNGRYSHRANAQLSC